MTSTPDTTTSAKTVALGITAAVAAAAATTAAFHAGAHLTPTGDTYPVSPVRLLTQLLAGSATVPPAAWILMPAALAAVACVWFLLLIRLTPTQGHTLSDAQKHLAFSAELAPVQHKARLHEAARLHPGTDVGAGLRIGRIVNTGTWYVRGWRDLGVCIFGTGRGKTSSQVIPHMADAPGPAAMSSNKPDGVDETLTLRAGLGQAWVFDPQQIYRQNPTPDFTFNPLEQIATVADAKELAVIFEASTTRGATKGDAQFDESGRNLLAYFFLAAALGGLGLADVFRWLCDPKGDALEPLSLLHGAGKTGPVHAIQGILKQPERTRGSVYATAQRMAAVLADDELMAWVTPTTGIRTFDPTAFLDTHDTLVLLSKEGQGSGGAVLTALVRSVCKNAEREANRNGGRLQVPLVLELDECANIVRWPELPSLFSFYGSLGIMLSTYFQSWTQGADAFGKDGMQTMWDAASCRVYGGGSGDDSFLKSLSTLIGEYDETITSNSSGQNGNHSTTENSRLRPILDPAALGALQPWRAVVFSSITGPTALELVPWFDDPRLSKRVAAAKAAGDPEARA